jgi:hypothetical protein
MCFKTDNPPTPESKTPIASAFRTSAVRVVAAGNGQRDGRRGEREDNGGAPRRTILERDHGFSERRDYSTSCTPA